MKYDDIVKEAHKAHGPYHTLPAENPFVPMACTVCDSTKGKMMAWWDNRWDDYYILCMRCYRIWYHVLWNGPDPRDTACRRCGHAKNVHKGRHRYAGDGGTSTSCDKTWIHENDIGITCVCPKYDGGDESK